MFKARNKKNPKKKGNLRRSLEDDNDEAAAATTTNSEAQQQQNDEEDSTFAAISRVKKKRKLLTELQFKKGTGAAELLKARSKESSTEVTMENGDEEEPTKQAEGLQTTKEPQQESIMEQKHKQALEQYVEEKLAGIVGDKVVSANEKALLAEQLAKSENNSNKALTKEELYQQLAKVAEAMIGKNSSDEENAVKEGDVGAGGAMLVSGTGLAEVVLPVEQRLKAVQATREAALAKGPKVHREDNMMPKSQVPIPGGVKGFFAVPSARRDFVDRKDNDKNKSNVAVQQPSSENALDNDRAGFDVSRGKTTGTGGMSYTNTEGSTNKRPYQQNKNKATDDKVYGNFVKHHRENQMRGRR